MDIKEIKKRRDNLQYTIAKLLSDFENETSLKVVGISYNNNLINFTDGTSRPTDGSCELKIDFR